MTLKVEASAKNGPPGPLNPEIKNSSTSRRQSPQKFRDVAGGMKRRRNGGSMKRTGGRPRLAYIAPPEPAATNGYSLPADPATPKQLNRLSAMILRFLRTSIARKHADIPASILAGALKVSLRTAQTDLAEAERIPYCVTTEAIFAVDLLKAMRSGEIASPLGTPKTDIPWYAFGIVKNHTPIMAGYMDDDESEAYYAFTCDMLKWEKP